MDLKSFPDNFFTSPDWFLHSIDFDNDSFRFKKMNYQKYLASSFLDNRIKSLESNQHIFPLNDIENNHFFSRTIINKSEINYIFQISFCCSTLLSRLIEPEINNLVLREPFALNQLAGAKYRNELSKKDFDRILKISLSFFQKKYNSKQKVIIKQSDFCNILLEDLLNENNKAIFLYSDLKDFLIAHYKEQIRIKFMKYKVKFLHNYLSERFTFLQEIKLNSLTDSQQVTYLWILYWLCLKDYLSSKNNHNIFLLNSKDLLNNPILILDKCCNFLGISNISEEKVMLVMNKHSKNTSIEYSNSSRLEEQNIIYQQHQLDINAGLGWYQLLSLRYPALKNIWTV